MLGVLMTLKEDREEEVGVALDEGVVRGLAIRIMDVVIGIKHMIVRTNETKDTTVEIKDVTIRVKNTMAGIKDMVEIKDGMIGIKDGMIGIKNRMIKIKDMIAIKDLIVRISDEGIFTDGTDNNALMTMLLRLMMTSQVIVHSREGRKTRTMALRM